MKEKDLLDLGYKKYEGETYDVYFNKDVCKHSGNCVKANHTVFQLKQETVGSTGCYRAGVSYNCD